MAWVEAPGYLCAKHGAYFPGTTAMANHIQTNSPCFIHNGFATVLSGPIASGDNVIGPMGQTTKTITTSQTLTGRNLVIMADATNAPLLLALPVAPLPGDKATIKKVDATHNPVTITGTIDGATNFTLTTTNASATFTYDATSASWKVI